MHLGLEKKNEMSQASVGWADDRFGRKVEHRSSNRSSSLDNFRFSTSCWQQKLLNNFSKKKKLESERCWTISDSAKSPTKEDELELWLQGKSKVFKGTAGIQRYIKLCKCTDLEKVCKCTARCTRVHKSSNVEQDEPMNHDRMEKVTNNQQG